MVAVVAVAAGAEGAAVKRGKNINKKWTVQGKKQNQTQGTLIN